MHYFRNPLKFVPTNNRSPKVWRNSKRERENLLHYARKYFGSYKRAANDYFILFTCNIENMGRLA